MKNLAKVLHGKAGTIFTTALIFALAAAFAFSTAACTGKGSGGSSSESKNKDNGKELNSAEALKEYLDSQPANSPDKPIKVTMAINDLMLKSVVDVIKTANKYVSLNLSGDMLTIIPEYAFSDKYDAKKACITLIDITIPKSVTTIGDHAFQGCTNLNIINVASDNSAYTTQDGVLYNKDKTTLITCPKGKTGAFTIPDSVTNIGGAAFADCTSLTSMTIPNSVTNIGGSFFAGCTNLTSVTIPDSVTSIDMAAFYGCTSLTSLTIPDSVTRIGVMAFGYCTNLTSVTFQGRIASNNFESDEIVSWSEEGGPIGDLRAKYLAGGIGTYTRPNGKSLTWTKQ